MMVEMSSLATERRMFSEAGALCVIPDCIHGSQIWAEREVDGGGAAGFEARNIWRLT